MSSVSSVLTAFDLLEKEFDRSFVDLDLLLSDPDIDDFDDIIAAAKEKMNALSSCFSQICHKSQIVVQNDAKLEAELINYKADLVDCQAEAETLRAETKSLLRQVHSLQLQLHSTVASDSEDATKILANVEEELNTYRQDVKKQALLDAEIRQLQSDKQDLKSRLSLTEKELFGARLAAKYLDKELAGRIQQIQLLGRNVQTNNFQKMWSQLEAEIHLHRHKTVIKACRGNENLPSPPKQDMYPSSNQGIGEIRKVSLNKDVHEGLGISVTVESLTIEAVYVAPERDYNEDSETISSVDLDELDKLGGNNSTADLSISLELKPTFRTVGPNSLTNLTVALGLAFPFATNQDASTPCPCQSIRLMQKALKLSSRYRNLRYSQRHKNLISLKCNTNGIPTSLIGTPSL